MHPPLTFPSLPTKSCRIAVYGVLSLTLGAPAIAQRPWKFDCASSKSATPLAVATLYKAAPTAPPSSATPAFGFDLGTVPSSFIANSCNSSNPFFFSIAVPDGNYRVILQLGGPVASTTTVRAESRRLFVDQVAIAAGSSTHAVFNVNVRSATIFPPLTLHSSTQLPQVKLKPREIGALDWDEKLTLEFNGDHPSVRSISIQSIDKVPTIYIAGDSTVVDQDKEPWAAWGQMLPLFFDSGISIANEAESGETIQSFQKERRLDKIMSTIQPSDYLMIQFGHNDQKPGSGYVPATTDFRDYLLHYISEARARGVTPILVTPMNRRDFDSNGKIVQTLGDYPSVMREVAHQQKLALIDLNAMSKTMFEAMGEAGTLHAFVHYPANTFSGQAEELKDNTHFNSYGAYELARAIVQSIRDQQLPLKHYLRSPITTFNPSHPDAFANWKLPPSPSISTDAPYGR
jgi:lysophospholipase L1-like esterase